MKRKIIYAVAAIMVIALIASIIRTNYLYGESLKPTQLSRDDYYEGTGFRIKADKYEVLDNEGFKKVCNNLEQYELYKKVFGETRKVVMVHYTIQITDVEAMDPEWWTNVQLESDIAWSNPVEPFLMGFVDEAKVSKRNFEDGKEYKIVLPYSINKLQVTEKSYDNAENWKYRVVWSQNPIYYTDLY